MSKISLPQKNFAIIAIGAVIGLVAAFMQLLEKLSLLENSQANLLCNINPVFSCTNLLGAWQSSVFGFPNSLMCIIFFVIMATTGIIGWANGEVPKKFRLVFQAMTLFFIGFGFWYIWQSIFVIGAMCIYCVFCYIGVLIVSYAWLRLNYKELPISKNAKKFMNNLINNQYDILIWAIIAIIIAIEMLIKFI